MTPILRLTDLLAIFLELGLQVIPALAGDLLD